MTTSATLAGSADVAPLSRRDHALVIWAALGALLPCLLPNSGPLVVVLSMVAPLSLADRAAFLSGAMRVRPLGVLYVVLVAYLCFNALFAPVTENTGGAIVTIALAGIACYLCAAAFPAMQVRDLKLLARGFVIGALLVSVYLFLEYATRMSLSRAAQQAAQALHLSQIRIDAGTWQIPTYAYLSRNLIVLIMFMWACLAFMRATAGPRLRQLGPPAVLLLVASAALMSPSATAKAGVFAGGVAWILARYAKRVANFLLTAGWLIAALACIPIANFLHAHRIYEVTWINSSLRHRMMIWSASAEWFWQHPILGVGIGGARKLNLNEGLHISAAGIESEPLNWHAHNIFIQAWFETGVLGATLLCLLGLALLRLAFRLPEGVRPYAVATFASIFVIGLTGFSLWAAWYLAGYGMAALCILLATFINRGEPALQGRASE